ncbi:MAG: DNA-binding transcriptional regulator, LysR family [Gammaproteobacteria bacterium]|nr:DNA-binding transcriptional regulator, LysR family [Gammaproteobacteria bacterium]
MTKPAPLSLDQLQVLLSVAEAGSFAGAARRLNRATSAVSYAVDTLESQLGIALFDRGTTRRAKLSTAGEAVVAEAKSVAYSAQMLRARVKGLREGLETEVSVVVDAMFPSERLVEALKNFHVRFPTVPLRLKLEALGEIERSLRSGTAVIGIGGSVHMKSEGLRSIQLAGVQLVPVAAPGHPLAPGGRAKPGAPREHLQLILTEQSATDRRDFGVVSVNVWRLGDLASKHALLLAGIGWGGMPEPMVRADVDAGRLVRLQMPDWRGGVYPLQVAHKNDSPPGPAGQWLIECLIAQDDALARF